MGLDTQDSAQDIYTVARQLHEVMVRKGGFLLVGVLLLASCSSPEERFAEKIEQANVNLEKGEVQKAIKVLEKLKADNPGQPQILESLAFAYIDDADYFTGAFYFNQLAQSNSENIDYYLYAAQAWVKAGDPESAIRDYEAYLLENGADWNTWQKIGDLYLDTNQTSKAIHAYSNSSQIRFNPQLNLKASLLADESGNLREAEAGFERLLDVEDSSIARQAYIGLVGIKHKRRQWEEVDKLLREIEKQFPNALNSTALKQVKEDNDKFSEAKQAERDKIKEEEERRQRLIQEQRERSEQLAAARLAAIQKAEEPEEAEEVPPSQLAVEEEVSSLASQEKTPSTPAADVPREQSPLEKALASARQIASTNSETAVARYWDAINIGDDTGVTFFELSRVYYNRSQFNESEMTALEALRRAPNSNRYILSYLQIIRKTKPKPVMVSEVRKYRRQFPKNPDLVLLLARIYAEPGGDSVAARGLYELFFMMAPNHPEFDRARYEARGI